MDIERLERLNESHDVSAFDAGPTDTEGQGKWLQEHGLRNNRNGFTRVFVVRYAGSSRVGAFFGLSSTGIGRDTLPRRLRVHGMPLSISATLIGRLAVDQGLQGQGLGRGLMLEALDQALQAHEHVASTLIIVDAAGEKAQRLYAHYKFTAIEDVGGRTTRMVLPMTAAAKLLQPPTP